MLAPVERHGFEKMREAALVVLFVKRAGFDEQAEGLLPGAWWRRIAWWKPVGSVPKRTAGSGWRLEVSSAEGIAAARARGARRRTVRTMIRARSEGRRFRGEEAAGSGRTRAS
jgi:hypothetical protein